MPDSSSPKHGAAVIAGAASCNFDAINSAAHLPEGYTGTPGDVVKRHLYQPPVTAFDQAEYDAALK